MAEDFEQLLQQLKDASIDKIEVGPDNFNQFQRALMAFEFRKRVVGIASQKGQIVYHYESDQT